ncbi:MAG: HlyD family efflux transporter periplasmic adaptor subunit, partial [Nitrospirae bacterium]|nr:HlyD family efflux transporter periplasmic adaptor subunit [Nitrospirota bacterium]
RIEKTITGVSSGTVDPLRRVRLQALLPLKIKEVNFKEGNRVKRGDVIVKLDDSEIKIKLDLQKAALTGAELRLHEVEERHRLASQNYERLKKLFTEGVIPDSVFDEAKSKFTTTGKEYEIAKNTVSEARLNIRLTEEELEKTNIRATFNGLISFLDATPGEFPPYASLAGTTIPQSTLSATTSETKPFCEIIDDSVLKLKVPFDEVDAMKIKVGQHTRVTSDTAPGKVFTGKVIYVSPVVSKTLEQNRTVDVEIDINKTDTARLPVGASVDAEIILEVKEDVMVVPTNAVIDREGIRFVYTVEGGVIRKRVIKTDISNWEFTQILDGLKEGDMVITSLDVEGIEEGRRVNIRDGE